MAIESNLMFSGLDLRENDINRNKQSASNVKNVHLDYNRNLVKRDGNKASATLSKIPAKIKKAMDKDIKSPDKLNSCSIAFFFMLL